MAVPVARVRYLVSKVQNGADTPAERDELARLIGRAPDEFTGPEGALILLAVALAAIAAALLIAALTARQ
jgi:hypothetical protein